VLLAACAADTGTAGDPPVRDPSVDPTSLPPVAGPAPGVAVPRPPDEEVPFPIPGWATGEPADHELDPAKLDEAAEAARATGSYCLLVIRHGTLVYERYFGEATAEDTHPSWSIAKSYSATLVGIAIDRGEIRSLDDSVAEYLPEWRGTENEAITVRDLVSMTSGLEWSVFSDYVRMATFERDHTEFALGLAAAEPPGSSWTYHNGAVQLLEPLFRNATGHTLEEYARLHLWTPLGMEATWAHDGAGHPTAYANVLATCRDHARLGYLYLHGGRWADRQILSESWVREALTPSQPFNRAYGYLFWLNGEAPAMTAMNESLDGVLVPYAPPDLFAARGFGNQFVDVIPSLDLVVVRFGEDPRSTLDPATIVRDARFDVHDDILRPILESVRR